MISFTVLNSWLLHKFYIWSTWHWNNLFNFKLNITFNQNEKKINNKKNKENGI